MGDGSRTIYNDLVALLSDIPMFYIKYLTMCKVHMYAGAIRKLLYGCAYVRELIHSLKLVVYPLVHVHKPNNNLHLLYVVEQMVIWSNNLKYFVIDMIEDLDWGVGGNYYSLKS